MTNFSDMLSKAKDMQEKMREAQDKIKKIEVEGVSGGSGQDDNPFGWEEICKNIEENLESDGFQRGVHFEIMLVPNITNITYGRGVGYKFEEEIFEEEISSISATEIRAKLREKGELCLLDNKS